VIITRSPLRIPLGGGGTDLPSYYEAHGGFVVSAAIDKYVFITMHKRFVPRLLLKYAELEEVDRIDEIKHPLIREALRLLDPGTIAWEICSAADIPSGTGLGSSGSFTTALLKALHVARHESVVPDRLAELACHLEIDVLREPVGKQDQYIATHGGLAAFTFHPGGQVDVRPLKIDPHTLYDLEDNLLLFFTGYTRSAGAILREQDAKSRDNDQEMVQNLDVVKRIGFDTVEALEAGDLTRFAGLMNVHWEHKKRRSSGTSNPAINRWHEIGMRSGALGGKLVGAGGGGFLLFLAEDRVRLRKALSVEGLQEVRFKFEYEGTQVLMQS
jgi:D-glycero-alpha-D-manno-heptose-7-phosphate kinase